MKKIDVPQPISIPLTKDGILLLPSTHGVYLFVKKKKILYVGKSVNIKARVLSHIENAKKDRKEAGIISNSDAVEYIITDSEFNALFLESHLIQTHKPRYNIRWMDDKSYLYIKITIKDQYPKLYPTRKPTNDSALYYGPFSRTKDVNEILNEIRKIFPFCTQKEIGKRACFYSKIKLCNPCPSYIENVKDKVEKERLQDIYKYNIKEIIRMFNGHVNIVIKDIYKKLSDLSKVENYEEAIILRQRLHTIEHLISARLSGLETNININSSQTSLQSLLHLLKEKGLLLEKLNRIECYDVSNMSFKDATASLVVMTDGLIDKSQYRKFKIKNESLQSDFDMMKEIITRRFKNEWTRPDLIVIDGGTPQLRFVQQVFDELLISIPTVGLAKNPDRLVINIEGFPVVKLSLHHQGFNLLRALRDEAHRFAKKYHTHLRSKKLLY
ncbi:MAG: GIY-YIG nuclease family protein [Candidatus Roizmanbacteria bacterium]